MKQLYLLLTVGRSTAAEIFFCKTTRTGKNRQMNTGQPSDQDLVSAIMPCYKAAPFVGEAIDSALRQTYAHTEVIVVDGGSQDSSLDIVAGLAGGALGYWVAQTTGLDAPAVVQPALATNVTDSPGCKIAWKFPAYRLSSNASRPR